jgi:DHA2 family multidrug resistance protein-like MFS transporter
MVTLGTGIMLGFVAPERAGAAAALQETSSELGFSLGIAAMGSLATVIYRSVLSGGLPADLTPDQQKAALETLAGAVDLAGKVEQGSALLASARDAFIASLRAVAGVEAGILLLVAIIAIVALRQVKPLGQGQVAGHADEALPQAAE